MKSIGVVPDQFPLSAVTVLPGASVPLIAGIFVFAGAFPPGEMPAVGSLVADFTRPRCSR